MADYWDEYVWIVVVGCFMSFFMAYGIGANDVANAFATSVGSKTLTLFQATVLAAIFEFLGALLLGRGVTDTVRKGIIDRDLFEDIPEVLMYGMLCALTAAGVWLIVATYLELPVSTTHSIIGGIVGMGLVARGGDAVIWHKIDTSKKFPVKGISAVVISWVFSPVASGIVAGAFFLVTRTLILRSSNSFDRTFVFLPVLVMITFFINAFYVLDKGINKQAEIETEESAWIAAVIAAAAFIVTIFIAIFLKRRVLAQEAAAEKHKQDVEKGIATDEKPNEPSSFFAKLSDAINSKDPHSAIDESAAVREIHDNAEVFETRTENVFRYLQVLTSCCDSFAHGANDVANAVGPFSAIWAIYRNGAIEKKSEVPIWILVIGGGGIVLGLATYGYTIIKAIGVKLTKITPSRGFCIEMGSALVVVTGSYLGLPLSTTHCQVGATVFVGLIEGARGVSWTIVAKAIAGWIFTLIVVGLLAAVLMAQGIFSPNRNALDALNEVKDSVQTTQSAVLDRFRETCGDNPAFLANLDQAEQVLNDTTVDNTRFPLRVPTGLEYVSQLEEEQTTIVCPAGGDFTAVPPEIAVNHPIPPPEEEEE